MECPKCLWAMKKLVDDDIADWMCYGCGDLWIDELLKNMTDEEKHAMHLEYLRSMVFKKGYYVKSEEKVEVTARVVTGGLSKWLTKDAEQ